MRRRTITAVVAIALTGGLVCGAGKTASEQERGTHAESGQTPIEQRGFEITNNSLDLAIEGDGFFQVIDGATHASLYTRNGRFAVNAKGQLVSGSSKSSWLLHPQVAIPSSSFDANGVIIDAKGKIWAQRLGESHFSPIGRIRLAKFPNAKGLLKAGENLYKRTPLSGTAIIGQPFSNGFGSIRQNQLERL